MKANLFKNSAVGMVITVISVFSNCKKDDYQPGISIPLPEGPPSLEEFHKNNQVKSQFFSINAVTGGSFIGTNGTKFFFPSNAFITQDGKIVTGNVTVELKEVYKKSEMILSDKPTMSGNRLLKSGGEYYIRVTSGGKEVKMAPGITYISEMPTDSIESGMRVFWEDYIYWAPITWYVADSSNNYIKPQSSPDPRYILTSNLFNWINCDYFWNVYPTTNVNVNVPDSILVSSIDVYLVFKDKAVAEVYFPKPYTFYDMPENYQATVVAIYIKDGKVMSSFQPIVIKANLEVNLNLTETTEEKLLAQLKALD